MCFLQSVQQLKTKAWADIVESLIGLIYLEAGENAAMEFLVYLGVLPEVPCGFIQKTTSPAVVEELDLGIDDVQLAADIAAAEVAAAAMQLAEQHQQNGAVLTATGAESIPALTPSAASVLPGTALPEVDAVVRKADADMGALGAATESPEMEAAQKGDTEMADATAAAAASSALSAGTIAPTDTDMANSSGAAGSAGTAQEGPASAGAAMTHQAGMLGKGLAAFTPALWSGPVLTAAVRGNLTGKGKPGTLSSYSVYVMYWLFQLNHSSYGAAEVTIVQVKNDV